MGYPEKKFRFISYFVQFRVPQNCYHGDVLEEFLPKELIWHLRVGKESFLHFSVQKLLVPQDCQTTPKRGVGFYGTKTEHTDVSQGMALKVIKTSTI